MPKFFKKGGSQASELVMEMAKPKLCDDPQSPVIEGPKIEGNINDLTLYKTTGGGRRRSKKSKKSKSQIRKLKGGYPEHAGVNDSCLQNASGQSASKQSGGRRLRRNRSKKTKSKINMKNRKKSSRSLRRSNKRSNKKGNRNSKGSKKRGGSKRIKNANVMRSDFRGGSDWRSTVYSRGPVNVPDMNPDQFRMFTQQGKYIPNSSMRTQSFMQ